LTSTGRALCFEHADQKFGSRPRQPVLPVPEEPRVRGIPEEVEAEDHEQITERVCAIDVAKGSGKVRAEPASVDAGTTSDQGVGRGRRHQRDHRAG
jgi:hypothetical protein